WPRSLIRHGRTVHRVATTPVDDRDSEPYRFSISISFVDTPGAKMHVSLNAGLRWLHATAMFVYISALCLAVALLVIAFIPGSTVSQELPAAALTGLDRLGGVTAGVVVDPSGWAPFQIQDPSLTQQLLQVLTAVPGL